MPFEDSRRLTGSNLFFDSPGAVLETVTVDDAVLGRLAQPHRACTCVVAVARTCGEVAAPASRGTRQIHRDPAARGRHCTGAGGARRSALHRDRNQRMGFLCGAHRGRSRAVDVSSKALLVEAARGRHATARPPMSAAFAVAPPVLARAGGAQSFHDAVEDRVRATTTESRGRGR